MHFMSAVIQSKSISANFSQIIQVQFICFLDRVRRAKEGNVSPMSVILFREGGVGTSCPGPVQITKRPYPPPQAESGPG